MKNQRINNFKSGQTLVLLIIFTIVATTITAASVAILAVNSLTATKFQEGLLTYQVAESGIENALIRLLRDPSYTGTGYKSEPALTLGDGTVTIQVTGSTTKTVIATAANGNFVRKIQAVVDYNNNIMNVSTWAEIP